MKRRNFVKTGVIAGAGMTLPLVSHGNVLGANDRIRIGIIGIGSNVKIGGKGKDEIRKLRKIPDVQIVALCDCDSDILRKEESEFVKRNEKVKTYVDFRELLDDKDIDVLIHVGDTPACSPEHADAGAGQRSLPKV